MAIFTAKHFFTEESVNNYAPNIGGVFGLYNSKKLTIYYGKSNNNIKQELLKHLSGSEGACTKMAPFFSSESCNNPVKRLKELLEEHMRVFEKLPKCNENP